MGAQVFAHELGHSLNMPHDFKGQSTSTARTDSSGKSCLTVAGMMSYKQTKTTWSTCSKEALAAHFKIMQAGSNSQITNCKKGSSGGTATTTGCSNAMPSGWRCGAPCAAIAFHGDCETSCSQLFFCFEGTPTTGKFKNYCQKSCGVC